MRSHVASAVAAYADLLRGGAHVGDWSWNDVTVAARNARGDDRNGLRSEFVEMVEQARRIVAQSAPAPAVAFDE